MKQLDFLTTLGHGRTGRERRELGIRTKGPTLLVTDLCVMRPDPETNEMVVASLHPGITREQVAREHRLGGAVRGYGAGDGRRRRSRNWKRCATYMREPRGRTGAAGGSE